MTKDSKKTKALDLAITQIDRQFGKGSIMRMGADHVSHNVVTEAIYARQLGIHFAVLNSISNPANGVRPYEYEDMQNGVQEIAAYAVPIVLEAVLRIDEIRDEIDPDSAGKSYEGTYTNPKRGGQEKE